MSGETTVETATEDDTTPARLQTYFAEQAADWVSVEVGKIRAEAKAQRQIRKVAEAEAESLRGDMARLATELAELGQTVEAFRAALRSAEGRAHGLPAEALSRIKGDDPTSIAADARLWAVALSGGGR